MAGNAVEDPGGTGTVGQRVALEAAEKPAGRRRFWVWWMASGFVPAAVFLLVFSLSSWLGLGLRVGASWKDAPFLLVPLIPVLSGWVQAGALWKVLSRPRRWIWLSAAGGIAAWPAILLTTLLVLRTLGGVLGTWWVTFGTALLAGGAVMGGLQSLALRGRLRRPGLWAVMQALVWLGGIGVGVSILVGWSMSMETLAIPTEYMGVGIGAVAGAFLILPLIWAAISGAGMWWLLRQPPDA